MVYTRISLVDDLISSAFPVWSWRLKALVANDAEARQRTLVSHAEWVRNLYVAALPRAIRPQCGR
jgi:hypothetical protein